MNERDKTLIRLFNTILSSAILGSKKCTPDTINKFIQDHNGLLSDLGFSSDEAYEIIEKKCIVEIIDSSSIIEDNDDHIDWFNPSTNTGIDREIDFHFWDHFKDYLITEYNRSPTIVDSLDNFSSQVLSRIEDPKREGAFDRRGMVIGSVQSGKTSNYTALISKAIDAGYKLIFVIAGAHNSLRSQTQHRLNLELFGYDLERITDYSETATRIGVRKMFLDHGNIHTLTSSDEKGDFNIKMARQTGFWPDKSGTPIVMVIKKNVSILKHVHRWASHHGKVDENGQKIIEDIPMLLIDDECDYASVNTREEDKDENGKIPADYDPTATNKIIRKILQTYLKKAYIGYTATPFANVLIHEERRENRHPILGKDLFPQNFIICLPVPDNYLGPEKVFGLNEQTLAGIEENDGLPLTRIVEDQPDDLQIIPNNHRNGFNVTDLPISLKIAIKSFIISCAVRALRKIGTVHNSMLIHVTRYTLVQEDVNNLVRQELLRNMSILQNPNDNLDDFKELYNNDYLPTSKDVGEVFDCSEYSWDDVKNNLYEAARKIEVVKVNGTSKDSLKYVDKERDVEKRINNGEKIAWEDRGISIIAIGGDKLSRGLTLEGLSVSYYLRASRNYDTLMQMGRWFGYREGYEDLCRIYTTSSLIDNFKQIATATTELRADLQYMKDLEKTPKDFGIKVLTDPGMMNVTRAGALRNTMRLNLSYSGKMSQTINFDLNYLEKNYDAYKKLLVDLKKDESLKFTPSDKDFGNLIWRDVSSDYVINFLEQYQTDKNATSVDSTNIAKFIKMQKPPDLTSWDVVFLSRNAKKSDQIVELEGFKIGMTTRAAVELTSNNLVIKIASSPEDEYSNLLPDELNNLQKKYIEYQENHNKPLPESWFKNKRIPGPFVRRMRNKEKGVLLLHLVCSTSNSDDANNSFGKKLNKRVVSFAVSFPNSDTTDEVEYVINSVYQENELI